MTTLEKFLTKRQTAKISENPKEAEKNAPKANPELLKTIEELKAMFPDESSETIKTFALQYPDLNKLNEAVQKILEENNTLGVVNHEWKEIKPRDKKKPEKKKKKYPTRKQDEYYEENYNAGYYGKGYQKSDGYYKNQGNSEKRSKNYESDKRVFKAPENTIQEKHAEENKNPAPEKISFETEKKQEEAKTEQVSYEKNTSENFPSLSGEYQPDYSGDPWGQIENGSSQAPKEIKESSFTSVPPEVIVTKEVVFEKKLEKVPENIEKPAIPEKVVPAKPAEIEEKVLKKEIGVQVDFDYGIPIIVYPYMFQRNRVN